MKNQKTILLIEDEAIIRRQLAMRLTANGYKVIHEEDGELGLQKIRDSKPNLIILDIMLPSMNGFQICVHVKKDPKIQHIPIILLSAKATENDKQWGNDFGADAYITKPYHHEDLISKVNELTR